jgi:tetraacyldisaccharide 4'-kinase
MNLKLLLWPLSIIYGWILGLRHFLYDLGVFKSTSFTTPTICVGNLSLGGTGKTPMISLLIEHYLQKGLRVAVVSRGYGRKTKGLIEATSISTPEQIGDEPFQLLQSFPQIRLVVCASRVAAMRFLESPVPEKASVTPKVGSAISSTVQAPQIVLLDDALQHRAIRASFNILLTSYHSPFFKDYLLPAGCLRDLKSSAKRAQIMVVTKGPEKLSNEIKSFYASKLKTNPTQVVVHSYLKYGAFALGKKDQISLESLKGTQVTLVTAIADATPLLAFLEGLGIQHTHLKYADHHFFTPSEIRQFKTYERVFCTEKDFVKLSEQLENAYYLPVVHEFTAVDSKAFYKALAEG